MHLRHNPASITASRASQKRREREERCLALQFNPLFESALRTCSGEKRGALFAHYLVIISAFHKSECILPAFWLPPFLKDPRSLLPVELFESILSSELSPSPPHYCKLDIVVFVTWPIPHSDRVQSRNFYLSLSRRDFASSFPFRN